MKNFSIALVIVAALTTGALSVAEARNNGHRNGAHQHGQALAHHRAGPRKFQRAVDRRQANQRARTKQGWHSGRLNRRQAARLHGNQKRIGRMERHFGADGHYSRHERRRIHGALNRSSKRIRRVKGKHHWPSHGYWKHGRFHGGFHRPYPYYRQVYRAYPIYVYPPSHSLGFEIETEEFRFSVNGSG